MQRQRKQRNNGTRTWAALILATLLAAWWLRPNVTLPFHPPQNDVRVHSEDQFNAEGTPAPRIVFPAQGEPDSALAPGMPEL